MKIISRQIEKAQMGVEAQNYASRKTVLRFDDVMNEQRKIIYGERNKVLDGIDIHDQIMQMIPDVIGKIVRETLDNNKPYFEWDLTAVNNALEDKLFPKGSNVITEEFVEDCDVEDVIDKLLKQIDEKYQANVDLTKQYGLDFSNIERFILLRVVDSLWVDHIDQMSILRNEIILQQYGQRDPVTEYKREGFEMFDKMVETIQENTVAYLLNTKIEIKQNTPVEPKPEPSVYEKAVPVTNAAGDATVTKTKEPGRNEFCPCGSGLKYKNCCGKNKK